MKSLTSLIREARPDDPLAVALEAMIERSDIVITLRDGDGRFVQVSPRVGDRLGGDHDAIGHNRVEGRRFFDASGREIALAEHPAQIARFSGKPMLDRTIGILAENGSEMWIRMSFLPLERDGEGWSVLGVGTDITELRQQEQALRTRTEQQAALLDLAAAISGRRVDARDAAALLGAPLARAIPDTIGSLLVRHDSELEQRYFLDPDSARRMRLTAEAAERWENGVHVNPDVQLTDIYGDQVIAERANAIRSIAVVPVPDGAGDRIGSIVVSSMEPNAYTDGDIEVIETAGKLVGPVLDIAA